MLTITIKRLTSHSPFQAFLSFEYTLERVDWIKQLPNRRYVQATKEWCIPLEDVCFLQENLVSSNCFTSSILLGEVKLLEYYKKPERKESVALDLNLESFKTCPLSYQYEALNYGLKSDKWLLGDEMGLGKTYVLANLARLRKKYGQIQHCLIICGINAIKYNWQNEIEKHTDEHAIVIDGSTKRKLALLQSVPDALFYILNVEALRSKEIVDYLQQMIKESKLEMIVVDEVHKCKNAQSQQGKGLLSLNPPLKIAATGTPLMNSPLDLYLILYWLGKEKHSFYAFKQFYCVFGGYRDKQIVNYKHLDHLQDMLNTVMLRRRKKDCLDLPDKIYVEEYVELSTPQRSLYNTVLTEVKEILDKIELDPNPLARMIRLRQATCLPELLTSIEMPSAKLDRLFELIEDILLNHEKVLIFSNWSSVIHRVYELYLGIDAFCITGDTPPSQRQALVDTFQTSDKYNIALGTIGAMGTGLTMTQATHVIFLDSPWTMAVKEQAEDRAHRIGTTDTVIIHTLIAKNTIDEKIEEIIKMKGNLSNSLIDGNKKLLKVLVDYLLQS